MKTIKLSAGEITKEKIQKFRANTNFEDAIKLVSPIVADVKTHGKAAVEKYAQKFGELSENGEIRKFTEVEIALEADKVEYKLKSSIELAYKNISGYHLPQVAVEYEKTITEGVTCGRKITPIESVGLYIPGGTAPLISTLLMLAIPAKIAGCKRVVVISPGRKGKLHEAILYGAKYCGVDEVYPVGGAQGVAMLAYGIEGVSPVDKIFGPGNQFVTAAKMIVSQDVDGVAIDMPAGPSEVLIIADEYANPCFIATDFLSQLEHGNDSQAILVTNSGTLIDKIKSEIITQTKYATRRGYIEKSLDNSIIVQVDNLTDAVKLSNLYAPEHLIINTKNSDELFELVTNAGSVFLGAYTPESAGDYASGTNHSLPTSGYASSYSGLGVDDFRKYISYQKITQAGLSFLSDAVCTIAEAEGLEAHANAVKVRLNEY